MESYLAQFIEDIIETAKPDQVDNILFDKDGNFESVSIAAAIYCTRLCGIRNTCGIRSSRPITKRNQCGIFKFAGFCDNHIHESKAKAKRGA